MNRLRAWAIDSARKARLLSEPAEEGYPQETDVVLGRPLDLPEPWKLALDTAKFVA